LSLKGKRKKAESRYEVGRKARPNLHRGTIVYPPDDNNDPNP
jgi:hypothetical protein